MKKILLIVILTIATLVGCNEKAEEYKVNFGEDFKYVSYYYDSKPDDANALPREALTVNIDNFREVEQNILKNPEGLFGCFEECKFISIDISLENNGDEESSFLHSNDDFSFYDENNEYINANLVQLEHLDPQQINNDTLDFVTIVAPGEKKEGTLYFSLDKFDFETGLEKKIKKIILSDEAVYNEKHYIFDVK